MIACLEVRINRPHGQSRFGACDRPTGPAAAYKDRGGPVLLLTNSPLETVPVLGTTLGIPAHPGVVRTAPTVGEIDSER
jgi:hypothetical protein